MRVRWGEDPARNRYTPDEETHMRIRKLFPLTFVAVALLPDWASGQIEPISNCVTCVYDCPVESDLPNGGETCRGAKKSGPLPIGFTNCIQGEEPCTCDVEDLGLCDPPQLSAAEQAAQLTETLAAIRAGESIPADGLFFYARRGADFVVRRKCGAVEMARVAIADIESAPVPGRG